MFKYLLYGLVLLALHCALARGASAQYTLTVDAAAGVDNAATCHNEVLAGIEYNSSIPCKTIGFALQGITATDFLDLTVNPGVYSGSLNTNQVIDIYSITIAGIAASDGSYPTIDCENTRTAITITPRQTASISQMRMTRCTAAKGGAITALATSGVNNRLEVSKCIFENNTATDTGGAIYSEAASLRVSNTVFRFNSASSSSSSGGAISVRNKLLELSTSNFVANSASQGGAVYGYNFGVPNGGGPVTISNCNFSNNLATTQGGAFFAEGNTGQITYSFLGTVLDNNCATEPYNDPYDVQVRCTPSTSCNITNKGNSSGCLGVYKPPAFNGTGDGKKASNKDRAIIIGVVVPFGVIFIVSIALYLFLRKKTDAEMEKREQYRKQILRALDKMSPEEQEAARLEAERADPSAPKCQLCMLRPINNPLPCGHAVVCSVCRTILLECPMKGCKKATR
jgi:predicted outer membrane repeat protein